MDFLVRNLVDINITKSILMQISLIHASNDELEKEPYKEIWQNALALSIYNDPSLISIANDENITLDNIPKTKKEYDYIQIRNDILIAKLYNITKEEMTTILSTFKVLQNKRPEYINVLISKAEKEL